ncbi:DUF3046 domain-containing protein [Pseudoclavibacter sp. RFBA6]|uniref:DUF3046 domain-containing protein n=1 Tax=Pseudoclavibacter sp. RFBA6 TaxID=2080573 RepID=UPI000CE903DE|nr:DUF3046 domain-containing protein [Pseudoclavibacter sp. RFBA6]PPG39954.1 DUF3046 domain-containing protein [Pseudoclavibacter sp. RFBA6]
MRKSEFDRAVVDEFGDAYGRSLMRDLVLGAVGDRTAQQALDDGVEPRDIWLALCADTGVPESRRHGVGTIDPRTRD